MTDAVRMAVFACCSTSGWVSKPSAAMNVDIVKPMPDTSIRQREQRQDKQRHGQCNGILPAPQGSARALGEIVDILDVLMVTPAAERVEYCGLLAHGRDDRSLLVE